VRTLAALSLAAIAGLSLTAAAPAYRWPVKPFNRMHPIRAAFDDPRFHLGAESALSAFHFGIDIAAKDGTRVYAVSPGYVRRYGDHVTVRRPASGHTFGYWHIHPAVRTGQHVRIHQFLGTIIKGWGHVHFAESTNGFYRNPLRRGALTPFRDRTPPTVASIGIVGSGGETVNPAGVRGVVDVEAEVYDTPPVAPPRPWNVARLTPALIMWRLSRNGTPVTSWTLSADFTSALMPNLAYPSIYAPGTYQNKANRPGRYLFWITHGLDTSSLPNGSYTVDVFAEDTRFNTGSLSFPFTIANPGPLTPTYALRWPGGHAE
jgi:murein DD-endopeptidase MepM/ murein hydrolase activator NlpD